MPYKIHLETDLGGERPVRVGDLYWDYTTNGAPMWRAAGADLAAFDRCLALDCIPVLAMAIGKMESDPDTYKALNPPDGWGSYDSLMPHLHELLDAFQAAPRATVRVSR